MIAALIQIAAIVLAVVFLLFGLSFSARAESLCDPSFVATEHGVVAIALLFALFGSLAGYLLRVLTAPRPRVRITEDHGDFELGRGAL
jgi:hypothetical protein